MIRVRLKLVVVFFVGVWKYANIDLCSMKSKFELQGLAYPLLPHRGQGTVTKA
jgi:hypothetical protein